MSCRRASGCASGPAEPRTGGSLARTPIGLGCIRWRRSTRRWRSARRGATAVEFALVAPLFVMMLVGVVQLGLTLHAANAVQWSIERAARTALLAGSPDQATLQAVVDDVLARSSPGSALAINWTVDSSGSVPLARITGTYVHRMDVPLLPSMNARFPVDLTVALYDD